MAKRWKKNEITYLKRYAKVRLLSELSERFKTDQTEVEKKLKLLGLASKDGRGRVELPADPLLKVYERGLKALHKGSWRAAAKDFQRVVDESEQPDLVGRARRSLRVCAQHLEKGGKPAQVDPFLEAVYERNRGNYEEALEICRRGGRQSKDERFAYLAASIYTLMDDLEKAAGFLELAIELNPKNRVHAFHDADFESLRSNQEYRQLFF